jgi:hypothetical protein
VTAGLDLDERARAGAARAQLRNVGKRTTVLELRCGDEVHYCLGVWRNGRGSDFEAAGDAKARSLPAVVGMVVAREARLAAVAAE